MTILRIFRHLLTPEWVARRAFPAAVRDRIEGVIKASEATHRGEIRFSVEGGFDLVPLLRGVTARSRALALFSELRVWDSKENTGVLLYLQLVDRQFEIVADRGINARVRQDEWDAICRQVEIAFQEHRYEDGVISGLREISALLARHFPARPINADELPNQPVVL